MQTDSQTHERYRSCLDALRRYGQEHLVRWWEELASEERERLLGDIESIPWSVLNPHLKEEVQVFTDPLSQNAIAPATVYPSRPDPGNESLYKDARSRGRSLIRSGKVAAFTVAGGQGSRLGFDGPKGCMLVTPAGSKTLFQLFAETILAVQDKEGVAIPWYIMTSPANHQCTVDYFAVNQCFGLDPRNLMMFQQRMLPHFDRNGVLLHASKDRLAMGPDGHGGSVGALHRSGALSDMQSRGVQIVSYFQVDNPLVKPFDPLFIGLHDLFESDMSLKATGKADDHEKVGNICSVEGQVTVVEYTDFPPELASLRNDDGTRRFDAANLAIHLIDVSFLEELVARPSLLPFRRAIKAVPFLDETGMLVQPTEPNAVKLEMFIFDVLPRAKNVLVLKVDRAEEFSPVKNATGVDSLQTSQRDQVRRACRWLEAAGVGIPRKPDGEPDVTVAISPRFALDAEDVVSQADSIPEICAGENRWIE